MLEELLTPGWLGLRKPKACILGFGLIGGSWAGALYRSGWEVVAVDPEQASIDAAVGRGWIQAGWTEIPSFMDVDLVVLALPLQEFATGLAKLAGRVPSRAIVTDVGSIKAEICHIAELRSQDESSTFYFIGGHPMTGKEQSGFQVADANLFRGFPYVLTPAVDCPQEAIQKLAELIRGFGANVVFRKPKEHDLEVGMISHIPHLLAVALTLAAQDVSEDGDSAFALAGRSFREITRIADSSPTMWKEVLVRNSDAVLCGLNLWEKRVQELREFIEQGDKEAIAEAFGKAYAVRSCLRDIFG